jgi:hypothetical protein
MGPIAKVASTSKLYLRSRKDVCVLSTMGNKETIDDQLI